MSETPLAEQIEQWLATLVEKAEFPTPLPWQDRLRPICIGIARRVQVTPRTSQARSHIMAASSLVGLLAPFAVILERIFTEADPAFSFDRLTSTFIRGVIEQWVGWTPDATPENSDSLHDAIRDRDAEQLARALSHFYRLPTDPLTIGYRLIVNVVS